MPEGPEIDTDNLRETVSDPPSASLLRSIALTTALFAALGAVASLQAGGTVNEALVLKTEAGRLQSEASDQWAYYQAKGIKGSVQEASGMMWTAAGKTAPSEIEQNIQRYAREQQAIEEQAHEKERERDVKSNEADVLLEHHHRYANSVALIQVSIALSAVAALTRQKLAWMGSIAVGLAGSGLFALTFLR